MVLSVALTTCMTSDLFFSKTVKLSSITSSSSESETVHITVHIFFKFQCLNGFFNKFFNSYVIMINAINSKKNKFAKLYVQVSHLYIIYLIITISI